MVILSATGEERELLDVGRFVLDWLV